MARGNGPTLNHMAYEMPNIDGLMSGAGRVRKSGYEIMWGVGRHGPGSNVFSYFVEPNGFVAEYTTEVEQVDDSYVAHDQKYWKEQNVFPCRWNMAGAPSAFARKAMSGELYEEENLRCEQVMAKAFGR
jgi:catechol 2,3-dioxygenase